MKRESAGRQNGMAIRAFREKDGMTAAKLAGYVGLHPQALRNIENGSRPASRAVIRRLAHVLDVPVAAITRDGTDEGIPEDVPEAEGAAA